MEVQEIYGEKGLYKIEKVKIMYYLGWNSNCIYMVDLDNKKIKYERR